jgi:plasmid stability protein
MKTTLDLPDPLMRKIKIRAAGEGRKLKDLVAELLDLGLAAGDSPRQAGYFKMDPEIGISVFVSPPDAPVHRMTVEEILRSEQESLEQEDLERAGISL